MDWILFAQSEALTWSQILSQNALVGIVLFTGVCVVYVGKRCLASDGIFTTLANSIVECNEKNAETLSKLEVTVNKQQDLCCRHAEAIATLSHNLAKVVNGSGKT